MTGYTGPTLPSTGVPLVDGTIRRLVDWLMSTPMQGHLNSNLADISDLTPADGTIIVGDGTDWVAESGATARASLGLGTIATQSAASVAITGGSITGVTDLAVADGGTGASTAADARTNLGLVIGTSVQAFDAELAAIAALATTDSNFIVGNGSTWVAESGATARTSLGLGAAAVETYAEGSWTPVLTFATPGDLSVTYSVQVGTYTRVGRMVAVSFRLDTSAFTHTTAAGNASITGLPFTARTLANAFWYGTLAGSGVTKASYTSFNSRAATASAALGLVASGSGQTHSAIAAADMPTGGSVQLLGMVTYEV